MSRNPTSKTTFRLTKYLLNSESDADDCTLTRGKSIQEADGLKTPCATLRSMAHGDFGKLGLDVKT